MILESQKQMKNFINMNAFNAMEMYPVEFAKAFLYLFESQGWYFRPSEKQEFVNYFREHRSTTDSENKWLDNNYIDLEFEPATYKEKQMTLKFRMKVQGQYIDFDSLRID